MAGDASAYAALGLEPGADPASVERAYKRLIKQHHPDREGGDSARAAEINRAYRELRSARIKDALELHHHPPEQRGGRGPWIVLAISVAAAGVIWFVANGPIAPVVHEGSFASAGTVHPPAHVGTPADLDAMDQPLGLAAIGQAVREAQLLSRSKDEMSLAAASEACHRKLRFDPTVPQLDRCAAFDDAVVQLQDRDPLRDRGPFSELAVTGRQWSAASALSNDYLAIDSRLDRIRLRVEMALAPMMDGGSD
jgi:hypothetical protein